MEQEHADSQGARKRLGWLKLKAKDEGTKQQQQLQEDTGNELVQQPISITGEEFVQDDHKTIDTDKVNLDTDIDALNLLMSEESSSIKEIRAKLVAKVDKLSKSEKRRLEEADKIRANMEKKIKRQMKIKAKLERIEKEKQKAEIKKKEKEMKMKMKEKLEDKKTNKKDGNDSNETNDQKSNTVEKEVFDDKKDESTRDKARHPRRRRRKDDIDDKKKERKLIDKFNIGPQDTWKTGDNEVALHNRSSHRKGRDIDAHNMESGRSRSRHKSRGEDRNSTLTTSRMSRSRRIDNNEYNDLGKNLENEVIFTEKKKEERSTNKHHRDEILAVGLNKVERKRTISQESKDDVKVEYSKKHTEIDKRVPSFDRKSIKSLQKLQEELSYGNSLELRRQATIDTQVGKQSRHKDEIIDDSNIESLQEETDKNTNINNDVANMIGFNLEYLKVAAKQVDNIDQQQQVPLTTHSFSNEQNKAKNIILSEDIEKQDYTDGLIKLKKKVLPQRMDIAGASSIIKTSKKLTIPTNQQVSIDMSNLVAIESDEVKSEIRRRKVEDELQVPRSSGVKISNISGIITQGYEEEAGAKESPSVQHSSLVQHNRQKVPQHFRFDETTINPHAASSSRAHKSQIYEVVEEPTGEYRTKSRHHHQTVTFKHNLSKEERRHKYGKESRQG